MFYGHVLGFKEPGAARHRLLVVSDRFALGARANACTSGCLAPDQLVVR